MTGRVRIAVLIVVAVLTGLGGLTPPVGVARADSRPAWLHLDQMHAETSVVPASALELSSERQSEYREQGYGTAELLHRYELDWKSDGTLVRRATTVRRYLTDEAVRDSGNMSASVRSQLQDLHVEEAWIVLPDGTRRSVDPGSIQIIRGASADVFSDGVSVVIPLEGLVPGATAVLVTRVVERAGAWPLPSSEMFFPQGWAPIERFELEVRWDDGLSPRTLATDAEFLDCDSGERRWICRADRIPSVEFGDDSTIWLDVLPHVVVGEPHTWANLVEEEIDLVAHSLASTGNLRDKLLDLIEGIESERDRLARIHRFVADEIRYVGMEHGAAAVAPAPVDRTIELRYGDCKGKVALFLALARHAGIRAYPVLVATGRNAVHKLASPSWRYFDHMIACTEIEGAEAPVCMDLTSPDAATGTLPPTLYGSVALDIRSGVTAPRVIQTPSFVWDIVVTAENDLHCDGSLTETLERAFHGAGAVWQRSSLRGMTAEDLRRWGVEDYRIVYGREVAPEVGFEGLEDPIRPLVLRSETEFEGVLTTGGIDYRELDSWLAHYARWFDTSNEHHPWWLPGVRIRSHMNYRLCPGRSVRFVGSSLDFESEFGKLRRRYQREPGKLEVETSLELPPQSITGENLKRFRRFLDVVLAQTQVWFQFEETDRPKGTP